MTKHYCGLGDGIGVASRLFELECCGQEGWGCLGELGSRAGGLGFHVCLPGRRIYLKELSREIYGEVQGLHQIMPFDRTKPLEFAFSPDFQIFWFRLA